MDWNEEKKPKKDSSMIVIKINPFTVERTLYITAIVVLLILLSYQSVNDPLTSKTGAVIAGNQEPVATEPDEEETVELVDNTEEETETVEENTTTEEETTTAEETTEETAEPTEVDAELIVQSSDIVLDGKKVTSVSFKVKNTGKKLRPKIKLYWYDSTSAQSAKEKIHGTWTYDIGISSGQTKSGIITTFSGTYTSGLKEDVELFEIKLFNNADGSFIDSELITKSTS